MPYHAMEYLLRNQDFYSYSLCKLEVAVARRLSIFDYRNNTSPPIHFMTINGENITQEDLKDFLEEHVKDIADEIKLADDEIENQVAAVVHSLLWEDSTPIVSNRGWL